MAYRLGCCFSPDSSPRQLKQLLADFFATMHAAAMHALVLGIGGRSDALSSKYI